MVLVSITLPPGLYRNGTEQQSAGRWRSANLMRWQEGRLRPVGGWRKRISDQAALTGACRAVLPWRDNDGSRWIAIGGHSKLYAMNAAGTVADITPSGFTAGLPDATVKRGYGMGTYGAGAYGTPRPDTGNASPASVWSLDTWGEFLVGLSDGDRTAYEWQLNTAADAAAIAGAPEGDALLVTPERFLMVFDGRKVSWSDQEDNTTWTPAATNQAGDFDLPTSGAVQQGLKLQRGALILTTVDAWQAAYTDPTYVYGFQRVGEGCGAISRRAAVSTDQNAVWMGADGFYAFDGYVQRLDCAVADWVFSSLNRAQKSKVTAVHNSSFSEVWWFYPSANATENDRAVAFNYKEGHWTVHALARTCGADRGVYAAPIMVGTDGYIYEHEVGVSHDGEMPYAETGPLKPGDWADFMTEVKRLVFDEETAGDYAVTVYARTLPNSPSEATHGPFVSAAGGADVLFQAGQARVRLTATRDGAGDVGPPQLDINRGDPLP
jgi:hypothetical protein